MKVFYVTFLIVILDQVSKFYVKGITIPSLGINHPGMFLGQRIPVMDDFFQITFVENPGMAFGFDLGDSFKLWLSLFTLVASIVLFFYIIHVRDEKLSLRLPLALILGGAIGNLIDRMFYGVFFDYAPLFYGRVVDFLDFDFFNFEIFGRSYERWPIFNIADLAVSIGVLSLILFYRSPKHAVEKTSSKKTVKPEIDVEAPATSRMKIASASDFTPVNNEYNVVEPEPDERPKLQVLNEIDNEVNQPPPIHKPETPQQFKKPESQPEPEPEYEDDSSLDLPLPDLNFNPLAEPGNEDDEPDKPKTD